MSDKLSNNKLWSSSCQAFNKSHSLSDDDYECDCDNLYLCEQKSMQMIEEDNQCLNTLFRGSGSVF